MSTWKFPSLAPPEYLDRKVQTSSESVLNFYSTKLGLFNTLKRIAPEVDQSARFNSQFLVKDAPAPFTDPPIVRSEAWSSVDFGKTSNKRLWIQFKTNFTSCIKSVKCRFTALGFLLGLLLSLTALIPITVIWQISVLKSKTTTLSPSNTVPGSASSSLIVSTSLGVCDTYFCEEQVIFYSNMTITALSLVVTIERTGNATYHGAYSNYSPTINYNYTSSTSEIIYTFIIQTGQLPAGNYTCAIQVDLSNQSHTTNIDQYSITTTNLCGIISTATGNFQ